jgi:hypothetical protein
MVIRSARRCRGPERFRAEIGDCGVEREAAAKGPIFPELALQRPSHLFRRVDDARDGYGIMSNRNSAALYS